MKSERFNAVSRKRLRMRMRTPEKLGQKCYGGNYWDHIIGKNTY